MIISPKNEFAQANHSRVICAGLSTENDSCIRSFLADFTRLLKQFLIQLLEFDVKICVMRAKGQIYLSLVCELPTPLMSPLAQKNLFLSDRMNFRVFWYTLSLTSTNLRQGMLKREGRLESSQRRQLPLPSTQQANISQPEDVLIIPYLDIPDFIVSASTNILADSLLLKDLKTEFEGTLLRTSFATNLRQLPTIALPGMLYGNSLGLSDGLNPVLIIPVQTADLITPPGSQLASRLKVQQVFPCFFQKAVSCISYSRIVVIRVKALKNLVLKKSI